MRSGILNKKANLILAQLTAISLFLSGVFGALIFKFSQYFGFVVKSLLGGVQVACGCQVPVTFSNHPYTITGLFILAVALLAAMLSLTIKVARIYSQTTRFIKKYTRQNNSTSIKLNHIAKEISLTDKITEIQTAEPMVFCYGFLHPRICISSAIISSLSHQELKAVLLHEQHHLQVAEPIKLFFIKIISSTLFFIPGIKTLAKHYAVFSELAADEAATDNFQNKVPLAHALNKILDQKENVIIQKGLAVSFFSEIIEERVNKLVDSNYLPGVKFGFIKLFSSLAVLAVLTISAKFLYPSYRQFIPAEKNSNCSMAQQIKSNPPCATHTAPAGWNTLGITNTLTK